MGFDPSCQVPRPGLAHLPSTGLLQAFLVLFKSETRFINQLGFREQSSFGYVSGTGDLQSPGQHFSTAFHCCPKDPLWWRKKGKEFYSWQLFSAS